MKDFIYYSHLFGFAVFVLAGMYALIKLSIYLGTHKDERDEMPKNIEFGGKTRLPRYENPPPPPEKKLNTYGKPKPSMSRSQLKPPPSPNKINQRTGASYSETPN